MLQVGLICSTFGRSDGTMGIHHYYLHPYLRSFSEDNDVFSDLKSNDQEMPEWPKTPSNQPSTKFLTGLRGLLPKESHWGACEEFEGVDDMWGSDLRIWHVSDDFTSPITTIDFRYSPSGSSIDLLEQFLTLCSEEDCIVFAMGSGLLLKPDLKGVFEDLRLSRAFAFTENPQDVLSKLEKIRPPEISDD